MLTIHTLHDHTRMSTQDLLLSIEKAVNKGETDFYVDASGQHDIGGPLWNKEGKKLTFTVTNPGQRVGCMALPNTEVIVKGSAPADVGWLNSGGRITVKLWAGEYKAFVEILDQGRGIPPEALTHLTEAFYRVDKSRSRAQGGAGLGLSLCNEIVQLHGGTMQFESRVGNGTVVTVELKGGRI